jgi:imidazolonepropionase-like amidohydrolase
MTTEKKNIGSLCSILLFLFSTIITPAMAQKTPVILKNVSLIDGNGGVTKHNIDVVIENDQISLVKKNIKIHGAKEIDMTGKTIMPSLISTHVHIGTLQGTTTGAENYTRENILRQLQKYHKYGINTVLSMGTDRPMLYESGLRDSTIAGLLPGARMYSAGYGFNAPERNPISWMNLLQRPENVHQVKAMIEKVAAQNPTVIKIWVDSHGGSAKKIDEDIYKEIIKEAHAKGIKVAAHVYSLSDAKALVSAGIDMFAHSIRDKEIDQDLLKLMKKNGVMYIPTLTLDEYTYCYANRPYWLNQRFFIESLEPGVIQRLKHKDYPNEVKYSKDYEKNKKAATQGKANLKKIFDAGILVALGTDSGAFPIRAQGFSEHLELELMVEAGISPLQAITIGTKNAAKLLGIDKILGTLEKGKKADFIVLNKNPELDIKNTRTIQSVWKDGKQTEIGTF